MSRTPGSLLPALLTASWLAMVAPGAAQSSRPTTAAQTDNFVHPPGTRTAPLGHLGNFVKHGTGPVPMILIPGAAFDRTVWDSFMKRNADRYTMYAVTQAGYGGTPPPPMPERVDDFAGMEWTRGFLAALLDLITREKLDRPVLVAHHFMADGYALRLALDHADQVRGVVVVAGRGSVQIPAMPRKPGAPVDLADAAGRAAATRTFLAPMYRTVTAAMWRAGSFPAASFCKDPRRAKELFEQQVAVPVPTQVRYLLEYHHSDVLRELGKLAVPLLVVEPRREPVTLEGLLASFPDLYAQMFGSLEKARERMGRQLTLLWGDPETGARRMNDPRMQWEEVVGKVEKMRLEIVEGSGTFLMDEGEGRLDELVRGFVGRLGK